MFIWDFVADKILGQIVDWFYGQVVGFLGNFFSEMGNMGAELFTMDWVQSIVLFFSYLAWALYGTGLVVACFETGVEYSSGRGNIREPPSMPSRALWLSAFSPLFRSGFMSCAFLCRGPSLRRSPAMGLPSGMWPERSCRSSTPWNQYPT